MTTTLREVRFALRRLARAPVFTLTVTATLALGIGGTTAVYSLVHGVLIDPLPYPRADRLVRLHTVKAGSEGWNFSMADYLALVEQQTTFDEVAAFDPSNVILSTEEGAERIFVYAVTPSFFRTLGIQPTLGRGFSEDEAHPGAARVAVVGWGFWQSRLGGDPQALGRTLVINDEAHEIVGVLPRGAGPLESTPELLTNLPLEPPSRKGPFFLSPIGRLSPGVRGEVAAQELRTINERIFPVWQDSWPDRASTWGMEGLKEWIVGPTEQRLWVAMAAVAFLLLIACTNTANLLIARGAEQAPELAVRAALGASRRRRLAHLLAESGLLSVAGSLAGLALAAGGVHLARTLGPEFLPRTNEVGLTPPVLVFFALLTVGVFVLAALVPGMEATREVSADGLAGGGWGASAGAASRRLRRLLVGAQFAVAAPLLIGGGLLLSSLDALTSADPGFDPDHLLTVGLSLPSQSSVEPDRAYGDAEVRRQFWYDLWDRLAALPGVEAVGTANGRPPDDPGFGNNFVLEDHPIAEGESQPNVPWTIASPGYFDALGVRLVAGRMFDMRVDPARVALVDETWARRFFGDRESAVGRRFLHGGCTTPGECEWWTVIGVVEDVEYNGISTTDEGAMYLDGERFAPGSGFVAVRTATEKPERVLPAVRQIIRDMEPGAPITWAASGRQLLRDSLKEPRYLTTLVASFGALALLLSLVGVYGVMAYFVEQRRREIGIRLALGGGPGSVTRLVLRSALKVVAMGTAMGLGSAFWLTGFMEEVLFGVGARDPAIFGVVAGGLIGAAVIATWLPARRAAGMDPVQALQVD